MSVKVKKNFPKGNYNSYVGTATKAAAMKEAKSLSKSKCGVVVVDYGKKAVKTTRGTKIKYVVMYPANQNSCKK